ncbi:MAG: hypothetical protein DMF84_01685 [Acidobacteria bacterium]|nr:MAG: hypothetical protein DMF84_01685 [Acidobacteriota bacterium]
MTALSVIVPRSAAAQRQPAPASREGSPSAEAAPATSSAFDAEELRQQLERLLDQYPPSLARVLRLDPTLLTNPGYLQPYPALATFIAQHPEVPHNPAYFLARYEGNNSFYRPDPKDRMFDVWKDALTGVFVFVIFTAVAGALAWLIKTVIDHRRWTRMLKIQTDAHTKLLDRFTSNEDLLAYMQTPAGKRFFESAPIPVESPRSLNAPIGRILWSAQVGTVLTLAGIGLEVVAARAIEDVSQPLSAIGVVVIALGIGFCVSAFMAYVLSKRLGLIGGDAATPELRG